MSFLDQIQYKNKRFLIEASIEEKYWGKSIPPYAKRMFFTGVLIRRKGIFEFVDAFVKLKTLHPEIEAVVIGRDDENIKEELIKNCKEKGVKNGLIFTGQILFKDIISLYAKGGIFCLSSHIENSPNVVMEAMAAGLPVVASDVGAVKNIVKEGESGFLVTKKDSDELADKVNELLSNQKQYELFGVSGRRIASDRWRPGIIASKHLKMYKEILSESSLLKKDRLP